MAASLEVLCFVLSLLSLAHASRLNVPKVLLPYYSSVATNFTLEVSDGCYTWQSSRPEVAIVQPVDDTDGCSSKAVVTALSKNPIRQTSIVIAQDTVSRQQLRCDVIVDVIHKIEIETTTRELYLEDSPEEFTVRALDDEGNTFSSLDSVPLEWRLISDTEVDQENIVDAHNVLQIQLFSDSSYETPPHIADLERRGLQGNMILVEGTKTGAAKVSAKLKDPVYKDVQATIVRLIVIANIILNPGSVYLLRFAQVKYKVELLKQGQTQEIAMPSQQYYLELKDSKLAELDASNSVVTALQPGETEIVLKDRNIKVSETFRQPTGGITVVAPGYLGFVVLPGRKWVLETNREYDVLIEIYDKDSHRLYPSDNVRITAHFPKEFVRVLFPSVNGTYHRIKTLKPGMTKIDGHLRAVIRQDGSEFVISPTIRNSQDVEIYDPIEVIPPVLVFPWDPVNKANYQYQLKAVGGSGNYSWSSSNSNVATVNVLGEISTSKVGETRVTAADIRNMVHTGSMKAYVLPPSEMQFVPSRVEAEIGSTLELPLKLFTQIDKNGKKQVFDDCRHLPFKIHIADTKVFNLVTELLPVTEGSCTTIKVHALQLGHTKVTAEYEYGAIKLSASVVIAAYNPLKPIDPEDVAVVAVGSSKEVLFEGGPQPWVLDTSKHYRYGSAEKKNIVRVKHIETYGHQKNKHIFQVLCTDLGEMTISANVGNHPTLRNKFPANAVATIRFACAQPVGLQLHPDIKYPSAKAPPCPLVSFSNQPIPVHSYKSLDIIVTVTDGNGRRFDNFSSLAFDWSVSNPQLAALKGDTEMSISRHENGRKIIKSYQTLGMKEKLGSLSVTATISRYNRDYFAKQQIDFQEKIEPVVSQTLDLMLVEDATITPDVVSIFNHPSNKVTLSISKGSGHFHIQHGDQGTAVVTYNSKSRTVQITPLQDGSFTIIAYDLCLETSQHASAQIHISGVNFIDVQVIDKVEVLKEIKAQVRVLDHNRQPLKSSYFQLMGLKPQPADEIITVRPSAEKADDEFSAVYIVKGISLGHTSLIFIASPVAGQTVSSIPKDIQVFPPLRLEPRNITLITGAVFQVTAYGGPQPQSTIEYSIVSSEVADISSSGLMKAVALGNTRVVGKAVGYESETGKIVVYSQDEVSVYVVQLSGVRIFSPLKRIQTGTQMPVYAMGINEQETPFTLASLSPPLSFHWSVNNKEVVGLKSVYYLSGIQDVEDYDFARRLFAKRQGHVTVRLHVQPAAGSNLQIQNNAQLSSEIQIQVFEKLELINPRLCDGTLIMTPNTEAQLRTNRDGSAKLSYKVVSSGRSGQAVKPVISISKTGQLVSGPVTGQASVLITAHEDFGVNQTSLVLIKVKPVSYVMLNVDTVIRTSGSAVTTVPVGTTLQLRVSYHDDIGEHFFVTNTQLKYRANRLDLLQISPGPENGTFIARATDIGNTVLKVWDMKDARVADYISVNVGYAIQPAQSSVCLGDIVCFSSPVISNDGHTGDWLSAPGVLLLDGQSGIAQAINPGVASVKYNVSNVLLTSTEIRVVPVKRVILKANNMQYLSNVAARSKTSLISVMLQDEDSNVNSNNVKGKNCSEVLTSSGYSVLRYPFRCELSMSGSHPDIDVTDLFQIVPGFDHSSGQYHCKVTQSSHSELASVISTLDTSLQLRVLVPASELQEEVTSDLLTLPFLPAFFLHSHELLLSNLMPLSSIRISATEHIFNDIKLSVSHSNIIEVLNRERDTQTPSIMHFPVRLLDIGNLWELDRTDVNVEVVSMATGQREKVTVRIKLIGQKHDLIKTGYSKSVESDQSSGWKNLFNILLNNYQSWLFLLFCFITTCSALFIGYHTVFGPRYQVASQQSGAFLPQGADTSVLTHSPQGFRPSPWNSPYGTNTSPSKVQLWSSGYEPTDTSTLYRRSPRDGSFH